MNIIKIVRKGKSVYVKPMLCKDLDKTKCSTKFLTHNITDEHVIYVKCNEKGELDLRGKKEEYRILLPDNLYN